MAMLRDDKGQPVKISLLSVHLHNSVCHFNYIEQKKNRLWLPYKHVSLSRKSRSWKDKEIVHS